MTLEDEVIECLEDLSYPLVGDASTLTQLTTFSQIVSWLSIELQIVAQLESSVNSIQNESDLCSFQIELKSLLRELNSPFIDSAITDDNNKLAILNHLCGHLLASRMNHGKTCANNMTISLSESETARDLKVILTLLGISKPPDDVKPQLLFKKIKEAAKMKLANCEDSLLLPNGLTLSAEQWNKLKEYHESFLRDYTLRREMLVRRCECTISSFKWKANADPKKNQEIDAMLELVKSKISITPSVTISQALACRESDCNQLINAVISDTHVNCILNPTETNKQANTGLQQQLQLHKFLIGDVPDRGGRPGEQPPLRRESFEQQRQQREGGGRGGRGGSGFGGGRGGGSGYHQRDSNPPQQQRDRYANNYSGDNYRGGNKGNHNMNQDYGRQTSGGAYEYVQQHLPQQDQQHYLPQQHQQQYLPQQHQQQYHPYRQQQGYANSYGHQNQYRQEPYARQGQGYQQGYQNVRSDERQSYRGNNRGRF